MTQPPEAQRQSVSPLGNRYHLLRPLGVGGMGTVFHAVDQLSNSPVALKRVLSMPMQAVTDELRLALTREFRALASLRHPHVIDVLDYGFDQQRQPFFTMELLSAAVPFTHGAQFLSQTYKIDRLLQLLQALVYIHRRGIIHRDIKPGNVLVQNQTVKLLDFGLATVGDYSMAPSGTLAYMAPELLRGDPPTAASDLYAVGVVAYELLAGWHPFEQASVYQNAWQRPEPDFTYLDVGPALTAVLQTLLSNNPLDRYADASEAIAALCRAVNRSLPPETDASRDSFLLAAPFVGRTAELEGLSRALSKANDGGGSAWLVHGESGIGKSRLLQELRVQALVQGSAVMTGIGRSDGGAYHLWRQIVRPLLLLAQPNDVEAAVLHPLVPDIAALLGRAVPPAPPIEARAAQTRLHLTIVDLVRRAALRQPLLLIFEDLHWSDEPGLVLLRTLAQNVTQLPLLLVGSCRPGERPSLRQQLASFTDLPLTRLGAAQVADLCGAVLGEDGRRAHLITFLHREAEGNTFFVIELMRALADEAGRLDQIGSVALPPTLTAGGMQRMVQRRLQRIAAVHQPLLHSAAVAGRQIDVELLTYLYPDADVETWLTACANAAVLERPEGSMQWQFSHAKLRDGLLGQLTEADQKQAHLAVARGLEHVYAASLPVQYEALAHHFGRAGALDKHKHYLWLAADHAEASYAHESALAAYERLLPLLNNASERATVRLHIGQILKLTGQWEVAHGWLTTALAEAETAVSAPLESQILQALGNLQRSRSLYDDALVWLERARLLCDRLADAVGLCTTLVEIGNVFYQQGEFATARQQMAAALLAAEDADDAQSIALAQHNLGSVAYAQSDYETARAHFEAALALRQTVNSKPDIANSYNNLGLVAYRQGESDRAVVLLERSLALRREVGDSWGVAASLNNLGMIAYQKRDFGQANSRWEEVLHIRKQLGDSWGVAGVYDNLALVAMKGSQLEKAAELISQTIAWRRRLGDTQGLAISLSNGGRLALQMGDVVGGAAAYRESLHIALTIGDQIGIAFALTGLAAVWAEQNHMARAVCFLAAANAHLNRINGRWETDEKELFDRTQRRARARLNTAVYDAAWQEGALLAPDKAAQLVEKESGALVS